MATLNTTANENQKPPNGLNVKINFDATTFAAEALACVQAIRFGAESGFLQVEVEGDALTISTRRLKGK